MLALTHRDQDNLAYHLNATLDMMEQEGHLPKTILYNLNPIYNDIVGSTMRISKLNQVLKVKYNMVQVGGSMIRKEAC